MAQFVFATHDYAAALGFARTACGLVPEGATLAGKPATVAAPSTWTVVGPGKPGNGPGRAASKALHARDLDEKANVKRMFSK